MVGNLSSLLAELLTSLHVSNQNFSDSKVTDDHLLNQTFELYGRNNMTAVESGLEIEIGELLNSSENNFLDCGTMPDIVWVKVCSFSLPISPLVIMYDGKEHNRTGDKRKPFCPNKRSVCNFF